MSTCVMFLCDQTNKQFQTPIQIMPQLSQRPWGRIWEDASIGPSCQELPSYPYPA